MLPPASSLPQKVELGQRALAFCPSTQSWPHSIQSQTGNKDTAGCSVAVVLVSTRAMVYRPYGVSLRGQILIFFLHHIMSKTYLNLCLNKQLNQQPKVSFYQPISQLDWIILFYLLTTGLLSISWSKQNIGYWWMPLQLPYFTKTIPTGAGFLKGPATKHGSQNDLAIGKHFVLLWRGKVFISSMIRHCEHRKHAYWSDSATLSGEKLSRSHLTMGP